MEEYFPRNTFQDTVALLNPELGPQESQVLSYEVLEKIFSINKTDIIVNRQFFPDTLQKKKYNQLVKRLVNNEPIQYIFKESEFYVDENVLIPRQETELLIQIIGKTLTCKKPKIADIGTGSGCIACSLAMTISGAQVTGYDVSPDALKVAHYNSIRLGANAEFSKLDILKADLPKDTYDLIVSNPPYVLNSEKAEMDKNVLDFEPALALFVPDTDPLLFYKVIAKKAKSSLKPGGLLFFEINEKFGNQMIKLLEHFGYANPTIYQDLNGKDRFASGVLE